LVAVAPVNADNVVGSNGSQSPADVTTSSQSDYIDLIAISAPVQSAGELDVQIVDNAVAFPLHAAACQRR
jgi:hypothetical protein